MKIVKKVKTVWEVAGQSFETKEQAISYLKDIQAKKIATIIYNNCEYFSSVQQILKLLVSCEHEIKRFYEEQESHIYIEIETAEQSPQKDTAGT